MTVSPVTMAAEADECLCRSCLHRVAHESSVDGLRAVMLFMFWVGCVRVARVASGHVRSSSAEAASSDALAGTKLPHSPVAPDLAIWPPP